MDEKKLAAKIKYHACNKFPFLTGIVTGTPLEVSENLKTDSGHDALAQTDGRKIVLNRTIINDEKFGFSNVLHTYAHELLHIALMHPVRAKSIMANGLNREWMIMYNLLADVRVNSLLERENLPLSKGENCNKGNIKEWIENTGFKFKDNVDEQTRQLFNAIAGDDEQAWERAFGLARAVLDYDPPKSPPSPNFAGVDLVPSGSDGKGDGEETQSQQQLEQDVKQLEQEIRDKMLNNLMDSKMRGLNPSNLRSLLENIYMTRKVNWAKIIRNCLLKGLRREIDHNYHNKKTIASGFKYSIPALRRKPDKYHIALAIDTSGSMSDETLKEVAGEIIGLGKHNPVVIDLFMCDAALQAEEYDLKDLKTLDRALKKMKGRGGTSFRPVFDKVRELKKKKHGRDYKSLVYFSDMYGDQDEMKPIKDCKTWWIVPKDCKGNVKTIPFGKAIVLE